MSNGRGIKRGMKKQSQFAQRITPDMVGKVPEGVTKQVETLQGAITDMIYQPKVKGAVQKMIKDGNPQMTIPGATIMVFTKFEDIMTPKNGPMPLDLKLIGGLHTFTEVAELAQAMGVLPPEISEEELQPLMKSAMQQYIQKGLKDKSIDPVELQQAVEPLMTDQEKQIGMQMGADQGVPEGVTQEQAQEGLLQQQLMPMQEENMRLKKQNQQMQGVLQGMPQGGK